MDIVTFISIVAKDSSNYYSNTGSRLLARHQSVLARLRREVEEVIGLGEDAQPPTRQDLKRMTYLSLVIKEGMLKFFPHDNMQASMMNRIV